LHPLQEAEPEALAAAPALRKYKDTRIKPSIIEKFIEAKIAPFKLKTQKF